MTKNETPQNYITAPGDYLITITWAQLTTVGQNQTPAYKVLCKTPDDLKIYATLWMTDKALAGAYWENLRRALNMEHNPGDPRQLKWKKARITVGSNERRYMEIVKWMPPPAEMPEFVPPVPTPDDREVPF